MAELKNIVVLGAGMVGSTMARDLAADPAWEVTVADVRPEVLARLAKSIGVKTIAADLGIPAKVTEIARGQDIVLGALSSVIGLETLRAVIEAGVNYCDISFMAEDATELSDLARSRGVTCVVDCGVAPGMSNMLAGYATTVLDPCERLEIYVGGLPQERCWPYEYKAGFAPHDVLEEYTRPSRIVEGGRVVVRPALSEPELLDFPGIGTLEAFNTDGLRSLVKTLKVPDMKEKTMRYPGHIELMRVLRDTGFFAKETIEVRGQKVRPLDVTAALLFPRWTFAPGEADLTVMRVTAAGKKGGRPVRLVWDLLDRYDPATDTRSMSRTTAFPATIMARMIAGGRFVRPGVHPPEIPGREPGLLDEMVRGLEQRGVRYSAREEPAAP
jgi:saccharopine dehydrogenase-like NADP-dependent oxidoreductase